MEYDDFRRLLAKHYTTENGVAGCMAQLLRIGAIRREVRLTAIGSALLAKTLDEEHERPAEPAPSSSAH